MPNKWLVTDARVFNDSEQQLAEWYAGQLQDSKAPHQEVISRIITLGSGLTVIVVVKREPLLQDGAT